MATKQTTAKKSKPEKAEDEVKQSPEEQANTSAESDAAAGDSTEELKAELAKQKDLLLRTAAEFDNYKKRTEREKASIGEYAKAALIKTLLPVIDNAYRAAEADADAPEFTKGAELIIKQLIDSVAVMGITETAQVGDTFDPLLHEAVMHIEDEDQPENCIVEVLQKGYKLNDTVLRPAMVKVAN